MSQLSSFSNAYESLTHTGVELLRCAWGSSGSCAIGFRGDYEAILPMLNLFANHGCRKVGTLPFEPGADIPLTNVRWLHKGLAYLTMTDEKLEETLIRAFYTEILACGEIAIEHLPVDADPEDADESWLAGMVENDYPVDDYSARAVAWVEAGQPITAAHHVVGEKGLSYETAVDVAAVERLARQYAARFMAEQIAVASFMPPPPQIINVAYAVGTMVGDPTQGILETLVEESAK